MKTKRILSVIIALAMVIGTMGFTALAADSVAKIGDVSYPTLQAAVDAAYTAGGTANILLTANITENVTINEKVGLYLTIDGANGEDDKYTINGTITIKPLSDTNNNRRITIQNVNFVDNNTANVDFINAVNSSHYPRLSVLNCSFTGSGNDGDVAIRTKSAYDLIIKNCTATGLHSFLQNTAGVKVTVQNVTLDKSKGGLALGTAQDVTVRGCNITTKTYGIRLDAKLDTSVTLNGNTVNAYIPVSIRNAAATEYKLTFSGSASSYTATNPDGKWCAICETEYEDGVALNKPTGNVKITWNSDVLDKNGVYGAYEWPIEVVFGDGFVKGFDSLSSAMSLGYSNSDEKTIIVHNDITESMDSLEGNITTDNPNGVTIKNTIVDEWIYCSEEFTIGEGVTYDATGYASGLFVYTDNGVINGTVLTDCYYQRYAGSKLTINEPGSMTVTSETFIVRYMEGDGEAGIYIVGDKDDTTIGLKASVIYFYQGMINAKDADIEVGTYWQTNTTDNEGSANLVLDNSNMSVTVDEHKLEATGNSTVTLKNGSNIAVAGGYEGVSPSIDATSSITKNNVSIFVASVNGAMFRSIQDAVNAAQSNDIVTVIAATSDQAVSVDKNLTITGNVALNNVTINAVTGCESLTVSDLSFTGNSWINSGAASTLTVSGVTANTNPVNGSGTANNMTNSRSGFISLGSSEQHLLALNINNCEIVVAGTSSPVIGWAAITTANITGNTFGSSSAYIAGDAIKFMSVSDNAEFTVSGNTVYSNWNGFVFAPNTTRDNVYTVVLDKNTFLGSADHVWIEVPSGYTTTYAQILASSDNTINGEAFTVADILGNAKVWEGFAGVDVVLDDNGKITGGTFTSASNIAAHLANGYVAEPNSDGTYGVKSAWTTDTDAGAYGDGLGMMRWLFATDIDGEVEKSGIKYIKAANITEKVDDNSTFAGESASGKSKAFYGDVVGISANTTGTYYAVAYVTIGGTTYWSKPIENTPNFEKVFADYVPGVTE